mgnify:FL=1
MSQDIPMASHLLASKVLGVSARKLAESMGPPVVPCLILYAIGLPLIVTLPLVLVGVIVGTVIYTRTPPGQQPLRFAAAIVRHYRGQTHYVWKPSLEGKDGLVTSSPEDVWLTISTDENESADSDTDTGGSSPDSDPFGLGMQTAQNGGHSSDGDA